MKSEKGMQYSIDVSRHHVRKVPVDILAEHTGLSKTKIKQAMDKGAVWIQRNDRRSASNNTILAGKLSYESLSENNKIDASFNLSKAVRLRRAKSQLINGDRLFFYYNPNVLAHTASLPQLIEDLHDFSVWDKPPGVLCQGSKWGDHCTLTQLVKKHYFSERECFTVHRLDRMTSGLIILAHNKKMAAKLSAMFAKRALHKTYKAIVEGAFTGRLPCKIDQLLDGQTAITTILISRPVKNLLNFTANGSTKKPINEQLLKNCSELELTIETGRKHQIRQHLAGRYLPILGDRLYARGYSQAEQGLDIDLQLRAVKLSFVDPRNEIALHWSI